MEPTADVQFVPTNLDRYYKLAEYLRFFGLPFAIAGDWNLSPSDFQQNGLAYTVPGAPLTCAGEGACRSAKGTYSMLDYWLTSADLHAACSKPRLCAKWPARPRKPVHFDLAAHPRQLRQLTVRAPKAFPRGHPSD
eukprot:9470102-Pyramimonas_sp.AAC.1